VDADGSRDAKERRFLDKFVPTDGTRDADWKKRRPRNVAAFWAPIWHVVACPRLP